MKLEIIHNVPDRLGFRGGSHVPVLYVHSGDVINNAERARRYWRYRLLCRAARILNWLERHGLPHG